MIKQIIENFMLLIIPKNDRFIKLMNTNVKDRYKNIVYQRQLNL